MTFFWFDLSIPGCIGRRFTARSLWLHIFSVHCSIYHVDFGSTQFPVLRYTFVYFAPPPHAPRITGPTSALDLGGNVLQLMGHFSADAGQRKHDFLTRLLCWIFSVVKLWIWILVILISWVFRGKWSVHVRVVFPQQPRLPRNYAVSFVTIN